MDHAYIRVYDSLLGMLPGDAEKQIASLLMTEEKLSPLNMQTTRLEANHEANTTVLKKFISYSVEAIQLFRLWPLRYSICSGNL